MHLKSTLLVLLTSRLCTALSVARQEVNSTAAEDAAVASDVTVVEILDYDPATPIALPWETDPDLWELPTVAERSTSSCKCGPTDACWPSEIVWGLLDIILGGRLIKTSPIASSCHTTTTVDKTTTSSYNAAQCLIRQTNWNTPEVCISLKSRRTTCKSISMPQYMATLC
jgi:hypothetical protein